MRDVRHCNSIVNFISTYRDESTYSVYDRTTRDTNRITMNRDTKQLRATARDVSQAEADAVNAFLAAEHAEYLEWREANKALFA